MSTDLLEPTVESVAAGLLDSMLAAGGEAADPLAREWQLGRAGDILAAALALLVERGGPVDGAALGLHDDEVESSDGPEVVVTVGGRRVYTVTQVAAMRDVLRSTLSSAITRAGDRLQPAAYLDARTPLYDLDDLDRALAERPGTGAPGQPKPRKAQR